MNIRADFDDFKWAKWRYTLSKDRRLIVRDPNAQREEYIPGAATLELLAKGVYDEEGALALAQLVGFLSVESAAEYEPVSAYLDAASRLLLRVDDFALPIPEPKNLPPKWAPSMDTAAISGQITRDGRVLMGAAKRKRELQDKQNEVRAAHERKVRAAPPDPERVKKWEAETRASLFNTRAQFRVRATIEGEPPVLVLRPATLADWCWYRLAGTAAHTIDTRKCEAPGCNKTFDVDLTDKREQDRKYCSNACRQRRFYHESRKTKRRSK